MADAMNFGPEWLRNLSSEGTTTGAPKYQLAEHRYGREEMLALFDRSAKPPDNLTRMPEIYVEKIQMPAAINNMTEDEVRLWNRGINSDVVLRLNGKLPAGPPGMRGRGTSVDRGRGRGRGTSSGFYYNRGNYEDGEDGGPMERPYLRQSRSYDRTQMGERSWPERNGAEPTDWNGSTSPRKDQAIRGGMDTWRRSRDDEDGWRSTRTEKWTTRPSSWREENSGDGNGGRSTNWGRGWVEEGHHGRRGAIDEVPEWATVDSHEPSGSFDASGAFHGYSSDEVEGQSESPNIRRVESARAKLFSDGSGEPRKTVTSGAGPEPSRRKTSESESAAPSGLTRSKTSAELTHSTTSQPPPNTISKSASSAALSESQVLDRIRTQHQNFVTKSTDPEGSKVKKAEKPTSTKPMSQLPPMDQPPPSRVSPSFAQASPPNKREAEVPPVQPHQGNRKRGNEDQGVARQGSDDAMKRLSMTANSVVRVLEEEEPPKTLQQPPPSLQAPPPSIQPPPSESDMWLYRDPQGHEQGPFRSSEMLSWYNSGYFITSLLVCRVGEERYQTLGDMIDRNGGIVPFSNAPAPPIHVPTPTDAFNPYLMLGQQQKQQMMRQFSLPDIDSDMWKTFTPSQREAIIAQRLQMQPPAPAPNVPNPYSQAVAHFMHQYQSNQVAQDATLTDPVRAMLMAQPAPPAPHHLPIPVMPHIPPPTLTHQLHNSVLAANSANDLKKDESFQSVLSKLQSASKAGLQSEQRPPVDSLWSGPGRPMTWTNGMSAPANAPLWNAKTEADILAAEQQKQLQLRAEEERKKEEKRKLEELRKKKKEEEEEERLEREAAEERQRLEEEKKRVEQEEKLRVLLGLTPRPTTTEALSSTQLKKEKEEKDKKKMEEAAKKKEEKKRKEDMKKLEEFSRKQQEEAERRKHVEEEERRQQLEAERVRIEREAEEARLRAEEIAQQQREEQQRRQEEALLHLKEHQQRSRVKPWTQSPLNAASLADIQAQEKEKKWIQLQKEQNLQEMLAAQAAIEMQVRESEMQNSRPNGFNLKWAEQPPQRRDNIKSLAEIQAEEQKRLMKQREKDFEERAIQQRDIPANAGIWGSASGLSWANQNNGSPWGGVTPNQPVTSGFWDDTAPPPKAKAPQSPSKGKPQANAVPAVKKQSKTNSKTKPMTKRDEAAVLELFKKPQGDEFTAWCIETLCSMQTSIDVPTFAAFLRDVENPFEVKDYIKQYLGETADAAQFANQFLERRSRWKSAQRSSIEEDDMCAPAAAINPNSVMADATENAKKD